MSHIVTVHTQVRDPVAVQCACWRLHLPEPRLGACHLFNATVSGWQVSLPGWTYPVVCETEQGKVHYDNFGGRWGEQGRLDQFLQAYAVEKAKLEARKQGYSAMEQQLANGAIKVTIHTGA